MWRPFLDILLTYTLILAQYKKESRLKIKILGNRPFLHKNSRPHDVICLSKVGHIEKNGGLHKPVWLLSTKVLPVVQRKCKFLQNSRKPAKNSTSLFVQVAQKQRLVFI